MWWQIWIDCNLVWCVCIASFVYFLGLGGVANYNKQPHVSHWSFFRLCICCFCCQILRMPSCSYGLLFRVDQSNADNFSLQVPPIKFETSSPSIAPTVSWSNGKVAVWWIFYNQCQSIIPLYSPPLISPCFWDQAGDDVVERSFLANLRIFRAFAKTNRIMS